MSQHFLYSLLQYTPAEGSGEVLNIGVLLLFPDLHHSQLLFPTHLSRLRQAFPGASERLVKGFLRSIAQRAQALSQAPELWSAWDMEQDSSRFIGKHLLIPDASVIRFSSVKMAVRYADPAKIAADYQKAYLSDYEHKSIPERQDEQLLLRQYKYALKKIDGRLLNRIEESYQLTVDQASYAFDFAWRNGRQNLVKALSFDVKRADTIQRKAERYFGQLTLLQPAAEVKDLQFDLLLARPQQRSLFASYDRALAILEQVPHTRTWEGAAIKQYSEYTAQSLLK